MVLPGERHAVRGGRLPRRRRGRRGDDRAGVRRGVTGDARTGVRRTRPREPGEHFGVRGRDQGVRASCRRRRRNRRNRRRVPRAALGSPPGAARVRVSPQRGGADPPQR